MAGYLLSMLGSRPVLPGLAAPLAAGDNLSVLDPASPPAEAIATMYLLVLAITGAIFVLVEGLLVYCLWRFRKRPAEPNDSEPPQIYGSRPIELAWTVAPALIVFVLFLVVYRTVAEVRLSQPPQDAVHVTVVGHQWWWEFRYHAPDWSAEQPRYRFVTANELRVPVGRPVYLRLESADVVHSFWVPRLAGKTDVIPNHVNHMWFQASQAGVFKGQCAEYCGTQHAGMLLTVIAQPEEEFARWPAEQERPQADDPASPGRRIFLTLTCVNCHTIRGTPAAGTFGPDLTHLASRTTLASGMLPNNRANLAAWLKDPQKIKPGCLMPNLKLTDRQVEDLASYLDNLR
jgi:cytochrome c oxidase subunit 2